MKQEIMDLPNLEVLPLHKYSMFLDRCCDLINEEWPRSRFTRLTSLQASCDTLPTSLILISNRKLLLGHSKLTRLPSLPNSVFLETVVISKSYRGKRLGTYLMNKVEEYCKTVLDLEMIHLSTKGQEDFYSKLGYKICAPVSIYGSIKSINTKAETQNSDKIISVPKSNLPIVEAPPPPPPPPMLKLEINTNSLTQQIRPNSISKTYMFKHLD